MPSAGFESTCPAIRRLQDYALDHTATGIASKFNNSRKFYFLNSSVMPIPVAVRSEALVCGILLSGIAGSNPAGKWMSVYCECCALQVQRVCRRGQNKKEINTFRVTTSLKFWRSCTVIFFSTGATTHCGFVFCSPLAGYSLLAY